jgi:hypothetical protein
LLFTVTSINGFYSSLSKSGLKLVCNVNIVNRNLKSENSEEYAQKLYAHEFGFRSCMYFLFLVYYTARRKSKREVRKCIIIKSIGG